MSVFGFVTVVMLSGCTTTMNRPTVMIGAGGPAPGDAAFARQMALRLTHSPPRSGATFHREAEEQAGIEPHRAR
jgi:hypothetical protein